MTNGNPTKEDFAAFGIITTVEDMFSHVRGAYMNDSVELNPLFFDFTVCMHMGDIIKAYALLRKEFDDDRIVRAVDGADVVTMVTPLDGYEGIFLGNCMDFLESVSAGGLFVRIADGERVSFI